MEHSQSFLKKALDHMSLEEVAIDQNARKTSVFQPQGQSHEATEAPPPASE